LYEDDFNNFERIVTLRERQEYVKKLTNGKLSEFSKKLFTQTRIAVTGKIDWKAEQEILKSVEKIN
jgi:hypothetical protein